MSIEIHCECGETYAVKDSLAGRRIRCPYCNERVRVPDADEETMDGDRTETGVTANPKRNTRSTVSDDAVSEAPMARSARPVDDEDDADDDDDRPRSRRRRDDDDDADDDDDRPRRRRSRKSGFQARDVNASIGFGVLMMIGAVVWFCGGLAFDIIFFYPPILFIAGIVAVVRGTVQSVQSR